MALILRIRNLIITSRRVIIYSVLRHFFNFSDFTPKFGQNSLKILRQLLKSLHLDTT
jgi:hypothetical protein